MDTNNHKRTTTSTMRFGTHDVDVTKRKLTYVQKENDANFAKKQQQKNTLNSKFNEVKKRLQCGGIATILFNGGK